MQVYTTTNQDMQSWYVWNLYDHDPSVMIIHSQMDGNQIQSAIHVINLHNTIGAFGVFFTRLDGQWTNWVQEQNILWHLEESKCDSTIQNDKHIIVQVANFLSLVLYHGYWSDQGKIINANVVPMVLHTSVSGLYKILLDTICNIIGFGNQSKEDKAECDKLHLAVVNTMKRQSNQMTRDGIMDGTKMRGKELWTNAMALTILMKTVGGKKLLNNHCQENNLLQSKTIITALLLLSCEQLLHNNSRCQEVERSGDVLNTLNKWH